MQFAKNWGNNWQVSRLIFYGEWQRLIMRDPFCEQYFLHKWKAGVAGFEVDTVVTYQLQLR